MCEKESHSFPDKRYAIMLDVETFCKTCTLHERMKRYTNICNWTYFFCLRRNSEMFYRPPQPNHPEKVTNIISESFHAEESGCESVMM